MLVDAPEASRFGAAALDAAPALAPEEDEQRDQSRREGDDDDHPGDRDVEQLDPGEAEHSGQQEPEPLLRDREASADRRSSTPGIEPSRSQPRMPKSTFPAAQCAAPATYSSTAAWKMSVPTTLCARSGKMTSSVSPKKTPLPTEVSPTMKPPKAPMRIAARQSRRLRCSWQIAGRGGAHEALRHEPGCAEEQCGAQHLPHHRLDVVAVAVSQLHGDPDADQRQRRRADEHPACEPRANVPHAAVLGRADRLEHRAVRDVRTDRGRGRDPEQEDEDRRHQRPAAHAGHPHEHAREETDDHELPVHCYAQDRNPRVRIPVALRPLKAAASRPLGLCTDISPSFGTRR